MTGLLDGPDGWTLAAEGAAIHLETRTAVVADVHLGYEWARAKSGDCVPAHSLDETIGLLASMFGRVDVDRLIVAGDLVESRRHCRRTARDVSTLNRWLIDRGVTLLALLGNHDPPRRPPLPSTIEVAGWTVGHGHRRIAAGKTISGHHHPSLRARGVNARCFLINASTIILPAFSPNAAGVGLATLGPMLADDRADGPLRCLASSGGALLDFGPVPDLLRALQGARC